MDKGPSSLSMCCGADVLHIIIDLELAEIQQHYSQVDFLLPRQKNSDNPWIFSAT